MGKLSKVQMDKSTTVKFLPLRALILVSAEKNKALRQRKINPISGWKVS